MRDLGLRFPVSEIALPAIHAVETNDAPWALCPAHGGTIDGNVVGRVYFCPHPKGLMFWRYARGGGMHAALKWPKGM